ncbi:hypothetical protein ACE6ZO_004070, partial [Salmonella enterica]
MVVLHLRKISRGLPKDVVAASQFTNLFFQLFNTLKLVACEPIITYTIVTFMLAQSGSCSAGTTAYLWVMAA